MSRGRPTYDKKDAIIKLRLPETLKINLQVEADRQRKNLSEYIREILVKRDSKNPAI